MRSLFGIFPFSSQRKISPWESGLSSCRFQRYTGDKDDVKALQKRKRNYVRYGENQEFEPDLKTGDCFRK